MEEKTGLTAADREKLLKQVVRELKPAVEDFVREETRRQLGARAHRDAVQEITLDVLMKFFRNLANRSTFFKNI